VKRLTTTERNRRISEGLRLAWKRRKQMAALWINVEFESVKRITDKAILFVVDGEDVWIPVSQIAPSDRDQYEEGDTDGSVSVSEWFANQKGLA
jgi:hypothetical protein